MSLDVNSEIFPEELTLASWHVTNSVAPLLIFFLQNLGSVQAQVVLLEEPQTSHTKTTHLLAWDGAMLRIQRGSNGRGEAALAAEQPLVKFVRATKIAERSTVVPVGTLILLSLYLPDTWKGREMQRPVW